MERRRPTDPPFIIGATGERVFCATATAPGRAVFEFALEPAEAIDVALRLVAMAITVAAEMFDDAEIVEAFGALLLAELGT